MKSKSHFPGCRKAAGHAVCVTGYVWRQPSIPEWAVSCMRDPVLTQLPSSALCSYHTLLSFTFFTCVQNHLLEPHSYISKVPTIPDFCPFLNFTSRLMFLNSIQGILPVLLGRYLCLPRNIQHDLIKQSGSQELGLT